MVKRLPASAGDAGRTDSVPGSGRVPGGGNGNPLQYSSLENCTGGGAWWAAECRTPPKRLSMPAHTLHTHAHTLHTHAHTLHTHAHTLHTHAHTLHVHAHTLHAHAHTLHTHVHTLHTHAHTLHIHAHTPTKVRK